MRFLPVPGWFEVGEEPQIHEVEGEDDERWGDEFSFCPVAGVGDEAKPVAFFG